MELENDVLETDVRGDGFEFEGDGSVGLQRTIRLPEMDYEGETDQTLETFREESDQPNTQTRTNHEVERTEFPCQKNFSSWSPSFAS